MPNRPKTYKDMTKYAKTRKRQRKEYYSKTAYKYERRPWTLEEDEQVLQSGITDTELSSEIERSVRSIQVRRWRLTKFKKD